MASAVLLEDLEHISSAREIPWDGLRGASVLITGGTGAVGGALVRSLAFASRRHALELRIIGHSRNAQKARAMADDFGVEFMVGDIEKPIPAGTLGDTLDYIIHCAAVTKSADMVSKPANVMHVSADGTRNVLELALQKRARSVVYVSSMEVYGHTDKPEVAEGDLGVVDLMSPRGSYPESKRFCESLCAAFYAQYQVPVKIARLAQTFGAGTPRDDTRVFAQFARSILAGQDIVLHTDGKSRGNYCYLADAVRALLLLLLKGEDGQPYNVANRDASRTIREMAELAAGGVGCGATRVKVEVPPDVAGLGYAPDAGYRLNSDKLRKLGWEPQVGLLEMYRRLVADWQDTQGSN